MNAWDQKKEVGPSLEGAVCVIDGDLGIQASLHMLLGTLRVHAVTYSTAEELLDRLNVAIPSILITELALPGMSGFELKRALDREGIQIPVIGLTGKEDRREKEKASRLGFIEVIEKPFVYWAVIDRVQRLLASGN